VSVKLSHTNYNQKLISVNQQLNQPHMPKLDRPSYLLVSLPSLRTKALSYALLASLIYFVGASSFIQAETTYPAAYKAVVNSITVDELKTHIEFLASDSLEGREAGSQGGQAAGTYIRGFLQKHDVKPGLDEEGYFQEFEGGFRNIIGIIPGNDPELKKEYVVIGAHYDHVGYGKPTNSRGGSARFIMVQTIMPVVRLHYWKSLNHSHNTRSFPDVH